MGISVVNDHVNSPSDQCQFNILNSSYDFIIMDLVHGSTIRIFKSLKFSIIVSSNKHNDVRAKVKARERVVLRFVRSILAQRLLVRGTAKQYCWKNSIRTFYDSLHRSAMRTGSKLYASE